jgi:hypothetical protein
VNLRKILPAAETTAVWLFLLQALRVLFSSWVSDSTASDHRMVVVEVQLNS